jgi:putative membrane protein
MLWIKAFHVIFLVTWFAGLFYLPRLYVYHTQVADEAGRRRFETMERKLFILMSIGGALTVITGLWLLAAWWLPLQAEWLEIKLGLVALLIAYHVYLGVVGARFRRRANRNSEKFFRFINEIPTLFLLAIVILAIVKPF